jgi:hypothetical protein
MCSDVLLNKSIKLSLSNTPLVIVSFIVACLAANKTEVIDMGTLLKLWVKLENLGWRLFIQVEFLKEINND